MVTLTYFLFDEGVTASNDVLEDLTLDYDEHFISTPLTADKKKHPRDLVFIYGNNLTDEPDWVQMLRQTGMVIEKYSGIQHSMLMLLKAEVHQLNDGSYTCDKNVAAAIDNNVDVKVVTRYMAVSAGRSWNLLRDAKLVEDFGKEVVLNWSGTEDLIELDTDIPGERGKKTSQKLNEPGSVGDFAVFEDIFNVMKVGAKISEGARTQRLVGGKSLRHTVSVSIASVIQACDLLLLKYLDDKDRPTEFSDLSRVEPITSMNGKATINTLMFDALCSGADMDLSALEPEEREEPRNWFLRYKKTATDTLYEYIPITDWRTPGILALLRNQLTTHDKFITAQFVAKRPNKKEGKHDEWVNCGSEMLCDRLTYVSQPSAGKLWIVSNGSYFSVPAALHERLNSRISNVGACGISMPQMDRSIDRIQTDKGDWLVSENAYNARVCNDVHKEYNLFDLAECRRNLNRSKLEICDIFHEGYFVHVKRYTGSAQVAAVCKQICDAAICLDAYEECWNYVSTTLKTPYTPSPSSNPTKFTFVMALITNENIPSLDKLTLKSKLSIAQAMRETYSRRFRFEYMIINYT